MAKGQWANVLGHIRGLIGAPVAGDLTDRQLLERFATRQEEAAFNALVQRHGPLVFGVCQRVLHNEHDAEDAFQAVFLVLAKKASAIPWQESVGNWLYGVAWRVAAKAKTAAARRQARERQVPDMAAQPPADRTWQDLRPLLDEELHRLPARYRAALVSCYLEGKTTEQAAAELGCPRGTVLSRLARGREWLRDRLARRGVVLGAAVLTTLLTQHASAAVPGLLVDSTSKAALTFVAGKAAVGAVSAQAVALAEGVLKAMFVTRLTVAASVLLALGVVGTGTGLLVHHALAEKPALANQANQANPGGKPRTDAPTILLAEVVAYEKDKSVTLEVLTSSGKRSFELAIAKDTEIRVVGGGKEITLGMNATAWADKADPKKAVRIVANPKTPTLQGDVVAYEAGKSITIEAATNTGKKKQEFAIAAAETDVRLLQGAKAIAVGMKASIWADNSNKAGLIEAQVK